MPLILAKPALVQARKGDEMSPERSPHDLLGNRQAAHGCSHLPCHCLAPSSERNWEATEGGQVWDVAKPNIKAQMRHDFM